MRPPTRQGACTGNPRTQLSLLRSFFKRASTTGVRTMLRNDVSQQIAKRSKSNANRIEVSKHRRQPKP